MIPSQSIFLREENQLTVLRPPECNPRLSQHELADVLRVSLGKTNYCLKAPIGKGFAEWHVFKKTQNKRAYAHLLTLFSITEKAGLTVRFLTRKVAEYGCLTLEIEALVSETNKTEIKPTDIHD